MGPLPGSWLAACMADLMQDLQVDLNMSLKFESLDVAKTAAEKSVSLELQCSNTYRKVHGSQAADE